MRVTIWATSTPVVPDKFGQVKLNKRMILFLPEKQGKGYPCKIEVFAESIL